MAHPEITGSLQSAKPVHVQNVLLSWELKTDSTDSTAMLVANKKFRLAHFSPLIFFSLLAAVFALIAMGWGYFVIAGIGGVCLVLAGTFGFALAAIDVFNLRNGPTVVLSCDGQFISLYDDQIRIPANDSIIYCIEHTPDDHGDWKAGGEADCQNLEVWIAAGGQSYFLVGSSGDEQCFNLARRLGEATRIPVQTLRANTKIQTFSMYRS